MSKTKRLVLDALLIALFFVLSSAAVTIGGINDPALAEQILAGGKADVVAIDLDRPHLMPAHDVLALLTYSVQGSDVVMTMVDGKILYENGEYFIGDEPERIYAEAEKIMEVIRP